MDDKIRIGFFIDTFYPMIDGVVTVVDNYAKRLSKFADVTVFAPEAEDKDYVDDFPYTVVRCKCVNLGTTDYSLPLPDFDRVFREKLKNKSLDIVHIHSPFTLGKTGVKYARAHNIPVVATMHSQFRRDFKRAVRFDGLSDIMTAEVVAVFDKCDECWAVNSNIAKIFYHDYGCKRLPYVHGNATDMLPVKNRKQAREEIHKLYNIPDNCRVFLFVGRINKLKNILFLADALKLFSKKDIPFRMLFIGTGQDKSELEDKVKADGIAESVVMCGRVTDREKLAKHYAASDLFLFPSLYDASSLVQIEAASQHVPTVFIRGAATADNVVDCNNGFLSDETPEAFSEKIEEALSPEMLAKASDKAFKTLYRSFDDVVNEVYDKYLELINKEAVL